MRVASRTSLKATKRDAKRLDSYAARILKDEHPNHPTGPQALCPKCKGVVRRPGKASRRKGKS